MRNNKKGFTLMEMSIVIALLAVIVVMVLTFINAFRSSTYNLKGKDDYMQDLTLMQSEIDKWLAKYDSNYYTVSIVEDGIKSESSEEGEQLSSLSETGTLIFQDGKLIDSVSGSNNSYETISKVRFEFKNLFIADENGNLSDSGKIDERYIFCTVYSTADYDTQEEFIFSRQSKTERTRYSSGNRTDTAKVQTITDSWIDAYKDYFDNFYTDGNGTLNTNKIIGFQASLYYEIVDGTGYLIWDRADNVRHREYGLTSITKISYSYEPNTKTLTCNVYFSDPELYPNDKEVLTWNLD